MLVRTYNANGTTGWTKEKDKSSFRGDWASSRDLSSVIMKQCCYSLILQRLIFDTHIYMGVTHSPHPRAPCDSSSSSSGRKARFIEEGSMWCGWLCWVKTKAAAAQLRYVQFPNLIFNPVCWLLILHRRRIRAFDWIRRITSYQAGREADGSWVTHVLTPSGGNCFAASARRKECRFGSRLDLA